MASYIIGQSKCRICKEVVSKEDDYMATLPFPIKGEDDPLYQFYECIMHQRCFKDHPLRFTLRDYIREVAKRPGSGKRFSYFAEDLDKILASEVNKK
ncbi:MAG: hypothetical protein AAFV33_04920 [Chloroflexota bacterium]